MVENECRECVVGDFMKIRRRGDMVALVMVVAMCVVVAMWCGGEEGGGGH